MDAQKKSYVMWLINPARSQVTYHKVTGDDVESQESLNQQNARQFSKDSRVSSAFVSLGKIIFAISYGWLAYYALRKREKNNCMLGNESECSQLVEEARVEFAEH